MSAEAEEQRVQGATGDIHRIELPRNQSRRERPISSHIPTPKPTAVKRIILTPPSATTPLPTKRSTRSAPTSLFPIGTIIRRRCENDNIFYEGEVTAYDSINKLYEIKYREGEIDDFTYEELRKYRKTTQKYRKVLKLKRIDMPTTDTDHQHDIFFIPTKANPNPVRRDYNAKHLAFLMQEQHLDYCEDKHYALAAGGRVWDEYLQKMASYKDLIQHKDEKIAARWITGGENEFGRLFQGFAQNGVEGLDILEWIPNTDVPSFKTVTYPRYTTAIRPEKDEKYRVRITAGGDRIAYDGDVSTHTASMETIKTWVCEMHMAKLCL